MVVTDVDDGDETEPVPDESGDNEPSDHLKEKKSSLVWYTTCLQVLMGEDKLIGRISSHRH